MSATVFNFHRILFTVLMNLWTIVVIIIRMNSFVERAVQGGWFKCYNEWFTQGLVLISRI